MRLMEVPARELRPHDVLDEGIRLWAVHLEGGTVTAWWGGDQEPEHRLHWKDPQTPVKVLREDRYADYLEANPTEKFVRESDYDWKMTSYGAKRDQPPRKEVPLL